MRLDDWFPDGFFSFSELIFTFVLPPLTARVPLGQKASSHSLYRYMNFLRGRNSLAYEYGRLNLSAAEICLVHSSNFPAQLRICDITAGPPPAHHGSVGFRGILELLATVEAF
jgi:hypothetical protein